MENYLSQYDYEALCLSPDEYILSYNNTYYKIGEPIYKILHAAKSTQNIEELYHNTSIKKAFSKADLNDIITLKILPIFTATQKDKEEVGTNFWIKRQLFDSEAVYNLSKPFQWLFGSFFYPTLFLFAGINIFLYLQDKPEIVGASIPESLGYTKWIISYFSLFLIVFLHEIGHAAAALATGIKPRSIGLGFYTVLPVMYTDLTDAWKVNTLSKVKINLGGIFMQLIIGMLLMLGVSFFNNAVVSEIFTNIFLVNSTIIVINLVPFLKFDGYWILADSSGISNLIQESNHKLIGLFTKKGPFDEEEESHLSPIQNLILNLYTVLRMLFIVMMVVGICSFVFHSIIKTWFFISYIPYMELNIDTVFAVGKRVLVFFIIYILTRKYTKMAKRLIFKRSS